MKNNIVKYLSLFLLASIVFACGGDYMPKPRGFFKIDLPEKEYIEYRSDCPFSFEYPVYGKITPYTKADTLPCWMNLDYPQFKGRIYLSYLSIDNTNPSLEEHIEYSRSLVYKHTIKADAIDETTIKRDSANVHGILYDIEGVNAATPLQFFLTDSTHHFLRGSLYFFNAPRNDSLAPVINFIREDVFRFIESFRWEPETKLE